MGTTLLGIDVGTTGVRTVVFDLRGRKVDEAARPCSYVSPSPGFAEVDPEAWWEAVQHALRELKGRGSLDDVAAVGVVGQAPTAVLLDEAGRSVRPAIVWLDTRAAEEARELGTDAYYLGPKLKWLAHHEPRAIARTTTILDSYAFVTFRLTGERAVDASTASLALPCFDLATKSWREQALSRVGVDASTLPPLASSTSIVGQVTEGAAVATGLARGTPVVVGGGDFAAAALGVGVIDEGEACLMLGTAGNLLVPRLTPGRDPRLINAHHVGVDRYLSLGGTLSGGAQEWLRHALTRAMGGDVTSVRSTLPSFDVLDAEAAHVAPGSDGLLFLPYLQGERTPIWDPHARGAYVGLGLGHGRGHLWRALLEGIALGFLDCLRVVEDAGVVVREVVATDGGGKSALFREILCDVLGVPLSHAPHGGGTVLGAALLAGLGVGAIADATEARRWRGPLERHLPDAEHHARYRALLEVRRETYDHLRPVFAKLTALSDR